MDPLVQVPETALAAFAVALVGGLVGSSHCVGMCGAFAGYHGLGARRAGIGTIAYHAGRLTTYLGLAAVAGVSGASIARAAVFLDLQRAVALMMAIALVAIGLAWLFERPLLPGLRLAQRASVALFRVARDGGPVAGPWLLGLGSTLLPCGFLYGFALAAAATGSLAGAAMTMLGFWIGTVPALLATTVVARFARGGLLRHGRRLVGAALVVIGLLGVWGRLPMATAGQDGPDACCEAAEPAGPAE